MVQRESAGLESVADWELALVAKIKRRLVAAFRAVDYQPPVLPAVALELLALSRQPNVSMPQITALMSRDPILTGQVLRLCQSAAFGGTFRPSTLEDAVVRLGVKRLADLFFRAALEAKVFRARGYDEPMRQLHVHSTFVAELSRLVCRQTTGLDDYAYLCGLLHDVGSAAAMVTLAESRSDESPPDFDVVWPVLTEIHETCGEIVGRIWKLPPDVTMVIKLHHAVRLDGRMHPVAASVFIADYLACEIGVGFEPPATPELLAQLCDQLGIGARQLDELRHKALELCPCDDRATEAV